MDAVTVSVYGTVQALHLIGMEFILVWNISLCRSGEEVSSTRWRDQPTDGLPRGRTHSGSTVHQGCNCSQQSHHYSSRRQSRTCNLHWSFYSR